jgi:hypothetical protein
LSVSKLPEIIELMASEGICVAVVDQRVCMTGAATTKPTELGEQGRPRAPAAGMLPSGPLMEDSMVGRMAPGGAPPHGVAG